MSEYEWLQTFGDNLRDLLIDAGMSQQELSDETGLSRSAISRYINKQKMPGLKAVINIAYALDCSLDDLIDFGDKIQ